MNFQVLSISFQALKRYFIFANSGYVWSEKKRMRVKRKNRIPEFFHKEEEKRPLNNLKRNKTSREGVFFS